MRQRRPNLTVSGRGISLQTILARGGGNQNGCPFDDPSDPKLRWNPSYTTNKLLSYDAYFKQAPQRIVPVLQGNAPLMYPSLDVNCANVHALPSSLGITVIGLTAPSATITVYNGGTVIASQTLTAPPPEFRKFIPLTPVSIPVQRRVVVQQRNKAGATICTFDKTITLNPANGTTVSINDIVADENSQVVPQLDQNGMHAYYLAPLFDAMGNPVIDPNTGLQVMDTIFLYLPAANISFSLSQVHSVPVFISYELEMVASANSYTDLTRTNGNVNYALSGTVSIPAGQTTKNLEIVLRKDFKQEQTELFLVKITGVSPNLAIAKALGSVTMIDSDIKDEFFAKPICADLFPSLDLQKTPSSWLSLTQWSSLLASRYGSAPTGGYPTNFSNFLQNQFVQSPDHTGFGKNLINYVEISNETDNSWADDLSDGALNADLDENPPYATRYYFRPREYAAMLSAAYDGNINDAAFDIRDANQVKIGRWGVKNLSSNVKVVMGGVSDMRRAYLDRMVVAWGDMGRGANLPIDVVNYHFYATEDHPAWGTSDWDNFYQGRRTFSPFNNQGTYPESANIKLRQRITNLLNDQPNPLKSKPVWITEFGYDSFLTGNSGIKAVGGTGDPQTTQGQWLTRYFLEASAAKAANGRTIEKMHAYELNDEPTQGSGEQFSESGLLTLSGSPKKAWYHTRTMLSALGAEKFISNNEGATPYAHRFLPTGATMPMLEDDPRIYTYERSGQSNKPTIVLWVPKGDNTTYQGEVLIKKTAVVASGGAKPNIQAVEYVDGDEDGKRTRIDTSLIQSYTDLGTSIQYWKVKGIRVGDTKITITETPLYLRVNQSPVTMGSDPTFKPFALMPMPNCRGCKSIAEVKWTIPAGESYAFYQVYTSSCVGVDVFDLSLLTLVAERLPGSAVSALVSDLSETACTRIWVVPFKSVLNGETGFTYAMGPVTAFVDYYPDNCQSESCTMNTAGLVQNIVPPAIGNAGWTNNLGDFLTPGADVCAEYNGSPSGTFGVWENSQVSFDIAFSSPQFINALNLFYISGTGRLIIEAKEVCCSNFTLSQTIDLSVISVGGNNTWLSLKNGLLSTKRVQALRITIIGQPESGIALGRMYFCTSPAPECQIIGDPDKDLMTTVGTTQAEATEINTRSAIIRWPSVMQNRGGDISAVGGYILTYSTALDGNGDLVQPTTVVMDGLPFDGYNELPLTPLVPTTTYHVVVTPNPNTVACLAGGSKSQFSFTTLSENVLEISGPRANALEQPPLMTLYPNPTRDQLSIRVEKADVYTDYIIHTINGLRKLEGAFSQGQTLQKIQLPKLPPGMYLVTIIGPNVRPQTKTFIVIDEE
jgi:Secretion system C-terminal sorting domain